MGTNRKRQLRASTRRIRAVTPEYIEILKVRDFLGELSENEIPLAKELGVYMWDGWAKGQLAGRNNASE